MRCTTSSWRSGMLLSTSLGILLSLTLASSSNAFAADPGPTSSSTVAVPRVQLEQLCSDRVRIRDGRTVDLGLCTAYYVDLEDAHRADLADIDALTAPRKPTLDYVALGALVLGAGTAACAYKTTDPTAADVCKWSSLLSLVASATAKIVDLATSP